ncbi:hypothetical protein TNCV_1756301 [Trichonephila clavipes]|nr:hypothetical protein TNCV_1756301 [Trichonephila clavipes]
MDFDSVISSSEPNAAKTVLVPRSIRKPTNKPKFEDFSDSQLEEPQHECGSCFEYSPKETGSFSNNSTFSFYNSSLNDTSLFSDCFSNTEESIEKKSIKQSNLSQKGTDNINETVWSASYKDNLSIQLAMNFEDFNPFNSPFNLASMLYGGPSSTPEVQFSNQPRQTSTTLSTDQSSKRQRKKEKSNFNQSKNISSTKIKQPSNKHQDLSNGSVRKLCIDFLDFRKKSFNELQKIELHVNDIRSTVDSTIKGAENICKKLEKIPIGTPENQHELRIENCKLKYLICTSSRLFSKMDKYADDLRKEICEYLTKTDHMHRYMNNQLENIINVICEGNGNE